METSRASAGSRDTAPGTVVWLAASYVNAKLEHGPLTYPPVQIRLAGRAFGGPEGATLGTTEHAVKIAA